MDLKQLPEKFYCPICDSNLKFFNPLPVFYKENAKKYGFAHLEQCEMLALETYSCPHCDATDRERLYAYWMNNQFGKALHLKSKIIHFAPESALSEWIRQRGYTDYKTADLMMPHVNYQVDITRLPFANDQYDFFICSHILEHVSSDDLAIAELYRIVKPGGMGIVMAPIIVGLEHTIEDPSIEDVAERWRLFGQYDHVRLYAHDDYVAKLKRHGFVVHELSVVDFGLECFKALGLKLTSILYIVQKPLL